MGVSSKAQGKGIGWLLGKAIVEKAESLNAKKIYLDSNTILKPAISPYRKLGFRKVAGHPYPLRALQYSNGIGFIKATKPCVWKRYFVTLNRKYEGKFTTCTESVSPFELSAYLAIPVVKKIWRWQFLQPATTIAKFGAQSNIHGKCLSLQSLFHHCFSKV